MKSNKFFKFAVAIIIPQLAGLIGSFFTVSAIPFWYANIAKPALNPPSWVFGPVWTTLYLLMGIAAYLVWTSFEENPDEQMRKNKRQALGVFGAQLTINAAWSVIFFGLQNPGAALLNLISLWLTIIATIVAFAKISRPAAWLLIPYILWVSFAAYLNYSIWILN